LLLLLGKGVRHEEVFYEDGIADIEEGIEEEEVPEYVYCLY